MLTLKYPIADDMLSNAHAVVGYGTLNDAAQPRKIVAPEEWAHDWGTVRGLATSTVFPGIKDAVISLATVALTLIYEFVRLEVDEPKKASALLLDTAELMKKLEIQFDLWLIAFSILLSAAISAKKQSQGSLARPAIGLAVALLLIFALFMPAAVLPDPHYLLRVWIPDVIGLVLVAWSVSATRAAHP